MNDMTFSLRKLWQFIVLAEEGNFTRAADRLNISQPSLSRSILQLEESCGLRLFDRGRLGVTLTAAGTDLAAAARQVLSQVQAIEQNLALQSRGEAGRVAIGIGPLAASFLMARLIAKSVERRPSLRVTSMIDKSSVLVAKVLDGSLDFAICSTKTFEPNPALATRSLGTLKMGYFVRAGHPLQQAGEPLSWDDFSPYPRATGIPPQPPADGSPRGTFGPLPPTIECNDYEILRQIMWQTDAIWLTSGSLLERELAEGAAVKLIAASDEGPQSADVVLVRLAARSQSPAMRHMIEVATTLMGGII